MMLCLSLKPKVSSGLVLNFVMLSISGVLGKEEGKDKMDLYSA